MCPCHQSRVALAASSTKERLDLVGTEQRRRMVGKEEKRHQRGPGCVFESLFVKGVMGRSTLCFWDWLRVSDSPPGCATTPESALNVQHLCKLPAVFSSSFLCARGSFPSPEHSWELRCVQAVLLPCRSWLWAVQVPGQAEGQQGWVSQAESCGTGG